METKKPTKAQLERRLQNAILFIERTKDTRSIYFSDRGVRLTITEDYAIVETLAHRHVFDKITMSGISRPYLYTDKLIDIALQNDCATQDGYYFAKLLEVLKEKENQAEYNIAVYTDWWIFNCFQPLYGIAEDETSSFLVYEDYVHNLARNQVILEQHNEDVTNKQFIDNVIKNVQEFTENLTETVILHKKTDEEIVKENIDAIAEQEMNDAMEAQINGTE
jgi:hypothetical protein